MKKRRINALLTAGCLSFLAQGVAQAVDDWTVDPNNIQNVTADTTVTVTGDTGAEFNNVNVTGAEGAPVTLTIDATNGNVFKTESGSGTASLKGYANIQLSPAIEKTITFTSTTATGASNNITQADVSVPSTTNLGTTNLGATSVSNSSSLTINNNGGTVTATSTQVGTSSNFTANATAGTTNLGNLTAADSSQTTLTADGATVNAGAVQIDPTGTLNVSVSNSGNLTTEHVNLGATTTISNTGGTLTTGAVTGVANATFGLTSSGESTTTMSGATLGADSQNTFTVQGGTVNTGDVSVGAGGTLNANVSGGTLEMGTVGLGSTSTFELTGGELKTGVVTGVDNGNFELNAATGSSAELGNMTFGANAESSISTTGGTVSTGTVQVGAASSFDVSASAGSTTLGATTLTNGSSVNVETTGGTVTFANAVVQSSNTSQKANLELNNTSGSITFTNGVTVENGNIITKGSAVITTSTVALAGDASIANTNNSAFLGTLNVAENANVQISGLKRNNYTTVNFSDTENTISVADSELKNVSLVADEVRGYNTSGTTTFVDETVSVGAGAELSISSSGTTTFDSSTTQNATNNSVIALEAGVDNSTRLLLETKDSGSINVNNVETAGNSQIHFLGTGNTTITNGINVAGENNTIDNLSTGNVNIGDITFANDAIADVALSGQHTISDIKTATTAGATQKTVSIAGTTTANSAIAATGTSLEINQTSGSATYDGATASGTLSLNAAEDATVAITNTIGMNGGTLNVGGAKAAADADVSYGKVTAGGINVAANTSTNVVNMTNTNADTNLGNITFNGNSTLSLNNVAANNIGNVSVLDGSTGNNVLNLNSSAVNGVIVGPAETVEVVAKTGASDFGSATLSGTEGSVANLTLSSTDAKLTGTSVSLGGHSNLTFEDTGAIKTELTHATASVNVSRAANKITNANANGVVDLGSNIQFADNVTSTLELVGTNGFNVDKVTAGGTDTLKSSGATITDVIVADDTALTIQTTAGTTAFSNADVNGTLTLNAIDAAHTINASTTANDTVATTLNNGTLNIQGAGTVALDGIEVASGTNNIVNSNTNANNTLNNITIAKDTALTITAEADTNLGNVDLTAANTSANSLALDAKNGNIVGGDVTLVDGSALAIASSTGTKTVTLGDLKFNGTNAGSAVNILANGTVLDAIDLSTAGAKGTINAVGGATFDGATIGNGSALTLNATTGTLTSTTGTKTTIDSGSLTLSGTQAIDLKATEVSGTSSIINSNTNAKLGTVKLSNSTTTLTGVKATNHDGITFVGNNTVNSNNSDLKDFAVAAGQEITVSSTGSTTYTGADVQGTLTLKATTATDTINGATTSPSTVATKLTNGTLNVQGLGAVTLDGVDVGGTSAISNSNTNDATDLGAIKLTNAVLTVSGLNKTVDTTDKDNFAGFEFTGTNNTVVANNSALGNMAVDSGQTLTLKSAETSSSALRFDNISINAQTFLGDDADISEYNSTVNLDATNAAITGSGIQMKTYNYGIGNDSTNTVNIYGDQRDADGNVVTAAKSVNVGDVSIAGANNIINNTNDAGALLENIEFTGTDASIPNEITLNGDFTSLGAVSTSGATDIINTNGDILLGVLSVGADSNLTVNANSGVTSFFTPAITSTIGSGGSLTLNAEGGNILAAANSNISLNGNATLALNGTNSIDLGKVSLTGTNNVLSVKNENANLGEVSFGDGTTSTVINTADTVIENIKVDNLTIADNTTWQLDVDPTNKTTDKITLSEGGTISGSKLNFELAGVVNPTEEKFVTYVKVMDSDNPLLNTTVSEQRNVKQVLGQTQGAIIYYSYVDASNPDYNAEDGDYAANTIRITDYNIYGDELLDQITRQGERNYAVPTIFDVSGTTTSAGYISALPNLEAREGVENSLTLNKTAAAGVLDAKNITQMFTVDTTRDGLDRTLNINGVPLANAVSTSTSGNGSAIITNSTDAAATVNISSSNYSYTDTTTGEVVDGVAQPAFENNQAMANGGAIYNSGAASVITSTQDAQVRFEANIAGESGGAIANVNDATVAFAGGSDFISNQSGVDGGAIANKSIMSLGSEGKTTTFKENASSQHGGAIANLGSEQENIYPVLGIAGNTSFEANQAGGDGGAIYNNTAILSMEGVNNFSDNKAIGNGGAIASLNNNIGVIGDTTFSRNIAGANGGALSAADTTVSFVDGSQIFEENAAEVNGGAISVVNSTVSLSGVQTFKNNTASGKGGAIYAQGTVDNPTIVNLAVTRAGSDTVFSGNNAGNESNAIYLDGNATINLTANKGSKFVFEDKIAGTNVNNKIMQTGTAYYNNDNSGYKGDFVLLAGDAFFTGNSSKAFMGGNYTLNGGSTLHLKNGRIDNINANSLTLANTSVKNPAKMTIDLDLSKEISDRFDLAKSTSGNILVTDMNITGKSSKEKLFFNIAEGADVDSVQKTVESDLFEYNISGQKSGLLLTRGKLDSALFAPQVAANARLAGQLDLYNQMLHRVDEIAEYRYFNKVNKNNLYASAYETIDNKYTPYVNQEDGGNAWMKPSGTIETIRPDSNGISSYKNRAYNTILGYETPVSTLRNGWEIINTVFGGYQGSYQHYGSVKNYQNGGTGGYMANLYKNNFFAGAVVAAGATGVDTKDAGKWGRGMTYALFDVGAAGRVGYNVGMGKNWVFQPMLTTSYIYLSGISRHNNHGDDVDMKGTNTLLISPGFKLVGNYSGWQPYAMFDYTAPMIARTVADVNNIGLPGLRLRPYLEYGVGLRKNFGDRFTGYGEAVFRNVGRTGVTLQGGFVYKF